MKCTDLLTEDHKIILRSLGVLHHMATQMEHGEQIDAKDVHALIRFFRAFADEQHHLKEESALFPELIRTNQQQGAPLRHMLFEHDQERSLVEGMEDAIRRKKNSDFVLLAERLASRMRNHMQKEDSILFPVAEAVLSKEQDEKIVAEFAKYETDPRLLADLRRLEWRYIRRVAIAT